MQPPPPEEYQYAAYPRAYGPRDFGPAPRRVRMEALSDAWDLFRSDLALWLLVSLTIFGTIIVLSIPNVVVAFIRQGNLQSPRESFVPSTTDMLISGAMACVMQFAIGILTAGILNLSLMRLRGQMCTYAEIFNFRGRFGTIAAAELLLAPLGILPYACGALAVQAAGKHPDVINLLFIQVGGQLGGSAIAGIVFCLCVFVELLILDRQMDVGQAFQTSIRTAGPRLLGVMGLMIVASLASALGACACGIGMIFTLPFYYLVRAVLYHDFFRPVETTEAPPPTYGMAPPTTL